VARRFGGSVQVQVFPAEQLAKAGENFPGVARGAFEAAVVNFQWGTTIPEMNVPAILYLSPSCRASASSSPARRQRGCSRTCWSGARCAT
jgi:TRAP-type C4-dicarboxylate transport system substrate-binding protein